MDSNNLSTSIRIAIVGDSTAADYPPEDMCGLRGWGQLLPQFLKSNVTVINFAKCGASSKSFIKNGYWETALQCKADYYFIQFGHNDCPGKDERTTDPNSDYQEYLGKYINDVRAFGGKPVLVTPMERRNFNKDGTVKLTLDKYVAAMKTIGRRYDVAVIDLNKRSIAFYESLGDEGSGYLMTSADRTHFTEAGARAMARLVVEEICSEVPDMRRYSMECK
ncbi:MAG: rhamnogalacturonan acetylesterase [Sedimentisphaerales bacterium]